MNRLVLNLIQAGRHEDIEKAKITVLGLAIMQTVWYNVHVRHPVQGGGGKNDFSQKIKLS